MWRVVLSLMVTCHIILIIPVPSRADDTTENIVWERMNRGIHDLDLRTIAAIPDSADVVYMGSSKAIYKTVNGGGNWVEIVSFKGTENLINILAVGTMSTDMVIAGTTDGLYMSRDQGKNWRRVFTGLGGPEA
ncbi:MAG: WD40/YVTN/BNR-like repeat-containing protein, partial [Thermodesulfobacteriota bacterium]